MEKTHQNGTDGCLWGKDYKWSLETTLCLFVFLVICNEYALFVKLENNKCY